MPGNENSQSSRRGSDEVRPARLFQDRRLAQHGHCQDTAGAFTDSAAGIPKYGGSNMDENHLDVRVDAAGTHGLVGQGTGKRLILCADHQWVSLHRLRFLRLPPCSI